MANVPSWFEPAAYFSNKLSSMEGWSDLELRKAFKDAGYTTDAEGLFQHFNEYGKYEGMSPNGYFNTDKYLTNKTIEYFGKTSVTPQQVESVRLMLLDSGYAPWEHYMAFGAAEGINPSASFDSARYMSDKLAIMQQDEPEAQWTMDKLEDAFKESGLNPLTHYYAYGKAEGLLPKAVTSDSGSVYNLTPGEDTFYGTAGDDYFNARLSTLDDYDYIDGAGGYDTLRAVLEGKNPASIGGNTPVMPEIVNVEKIIFQSQQGNTNTGNNMPSGASVDAQLINGMQHLQNDSSRAYLVVEDVQSYSNEMTIEWSNANAGRGDAQVGVAPLYPSQVGVDFEVYFDPQHLKAAGSSTAEVQIQLIDLKSAQESNNSSPLLVNPYTALTIEYTPDGGASRLITLDLAKYADTADYTGATANHTTLVRAFNAAIEALGLSNQIKAVLGDAFTETSTTASGTWTGSGNFVTLTSTGGSIRTQNDDGSAIQDTGWSLSGPVPPTSAFISDATTAVLDCPLIQTNIYLDNVGKVQWGDISDCLPNNSIYGSEAGDLVVGSMANRGGVERFDVTVGRGSWITSLLSTNEALRMVTATSDMTNQNTVKEANKAGPGQLFIGAQLDNDPHFGYMNDYTPTNSFPGNTPIRDNQAITDNSLAQWTDRAFLLATNGLQDVKWFHAQEFEGNINLGASITDSSFQKYLRDVDGVWAPEDSNAPGTTPKDQFQYKLGKNSDVLNMSLDSGIAADRDFQLVVEAGNGNDFINFRFDGLITPNQIINSDNLRNVILNGDAGNDTIKVWGNTAVSANGGAGNDVIFVSQLSDQTTGGTPVGAAEQNAIFIFNAANLVDRGVITTNEGAQSIYNDIQSTRASVGFTLGTQATAGSTVTLEVVVNFKGMTAAFKVNGTMTGTTGATTTGTITTDALNSAIIKAIASDPVLSNVLVAKDGAGYSLLVESLIDGQMDINDLGIGLRFPSTTNTVVGWDADGAYDTNFATDGTGASFVPDTALLIFENQVNGNAATGTKMSFDVRAVNPAQLQAGKIVNFAVRDAGGTEHTFENYTLKGATVDEILVNIMQDLSLPMNGTYLTGTDATDGKVTFIASTDITQDAPLGIQDSHWQEVTTTPITVTLSNPVNGDGAGMGIGATHMSCEVTVTGLGSVKAGDIINLNFTLNGDEYVVRNLMVSGTTNDELLANILSNAHNLNTSQPLPDALLGAHVGGIGSFMPTGATGDGTILFQEVLNAGGAPIPAPAATASTGGGLLQGTFMQTGNIDIDVTLSNLQDGVSGGAAMTFTLNFDNADALAATLAQNTGNYAITFEGGIAGDTVFYVEDYRAPSVPGTTAQGILLDFLNNLVTRDTAGNGMERPMSAAWGGTWTVVGGEFVFTQNVGVGTFLPTAPTGADGSDFTYVTYDPELVPAPSGSGAEWTGTNTGTDSLNRVDGGIGDDVIVLNAGSDAQWYDTLVLSGSFNDDTVFNFDSGFDKIEFNVGATRGFVNGNGTALTGNGTNGAVTLTQIAGLVGTAGVNGKSIGYILDTNASGAVDKGNVYIFFEVNNDGNATVTNQEVKVLGTITVEDDVTIATTDVITAA